MPAKQQKITINNDGVRQTVDYETLLKLVYDRVWELWRDDLRRTRERVSKARRR
jgi:hypothetical protein